MQTDLSNICKKTCTGVHERYTAKDCTEQHSLLALSVVSRCVSKGHHVGGGQRLQPAADQRVL